MAGSKKKSRTILVLSENMTSETRPLMSKKRIHCSKGEAANEA